MINENIAKSIWLQALSYFTRCKTYSGWHITTSTGHLINTPEDIYHVTEDIPDRHIGRGSRGVIVLDLIVRDVEVLID